MIRNKVMHNNEDTSKKHVDRLMTQPRWNKTIESVQNNCLRFISYTFNVLGTILSHIPLLYLS